MSRLKMFWSNCVTTFILIVGMSFQYTKTMNPNQNTVAKHFENIQKALANFNNDYADSTLYANANTLLKTIFCRNSCPNTLIKISINQEGKIDYNNLTKEIAIDPKAPLSNFKDIITEKINGTILNQENKIYSRTIDELHRSLYSNENLKLICTIVKRFLPEENSELAKKNLEQAEKFIALNKHMNAYVPYYNPETLAAPFCSYILSCILDHIKEEGNLRYEYYKPEKQAPKEKSHARQFKLIGSCSALIVLLSAVLYWFYKK